MDARWVPLLAAGLGVLGGITGAFVGGTLANEGAESRFESERSDAAQALRREAYAEFIGSADEVALTLEANRPEDEISSALRRLLVTKGRVLIVAEDNDEVGDAAVVAFDTLSDWTDAHNDGESAEDLKDERAAYYGDGEEVEGAINRFLAEAQGDIEAAKE